MDNLTPRQKSRLLQDRLFKSYMTIIDKIEARLASDETLSPAEMVQLARCLADLRNSENWSRKLERAITRNPSLMGNPSVRNGSVLNSLRGLTSQTFKQIRGDGRTSGAQVKRQSRVSLPGIAGVDYPADD